MKDPFKRQFRHLPKSYQAGLDYLSKKLSELEKQELEGLKERQKKRKSKK